MHRRTFLHSALGTALATSLAHAQSTRRPRILLRNAWQSINIGDIAHYLGLLELFEKFSIDAEVRLWPSHLDHGAGDLLRKRFPKVIILEDQQAIATALQECDFFLHGSGSGIPGWKELKRWHEETGKPFGVLGVSLTSSAQNVIDLLGKGDFVFFRDGVSLRKAKELGCKAPIMDFGPDTAFGVVTLRDDASATAFLREHQLEEGRFLCCIPRYRWTPGWTVYPGRPVDEVKLARSNEMKDRDHAPHRAAIVAIARETDLKVLVTCEDQTQIALGKEMLFDPLPDDVKKKVVWRDRYWLPDEALSTYVRSAGLFGNEMHSPIMCIASGIPAIVCRWDEQTNKGFMWRDLALDEWLFDMDRPDEVARIAPTVLALAKDPAAAKAKAAKARTIVQRRQQEEMRALSDALKKAAAR